MRAAPLLTGFARPRVSAWSPPSPPARAQHTLFVQGTRDTFLAGDGLACLHRTTDRMAGRVTVFAVPGGTHTVPMATGLAAHGTTKQLVASDVADAIATFVAAACEP